MKKIFRAQRKKLGSPSGHVTASMPWRFDRRSANALPNPYLNLRRNDSNGWGPLHFTTVIPAYAGIQCLPSRHKEQQIRSQKIPALKIAGFFTPEQKRGAIKKPTVYSVGQTLQELLTIFSIPMYWTQNSNALLTSRRAKQPWLMIKICNYPLAGTSSVSALPSPAGKY